MKMQYRDSLSFYDLGQRLNTQALFDRLRTTKERVQNVRTIEDWCSVLESAEFLNEWGQIFVDEYRESVSEDLVEYTLRNFREILHRGEQLPLYPEAYDLSAKINNREYARHTLVAGVVEPVVNRLSQSHRGEERGVEWEDEPRLRQELRQLIWALVEMIEDEQVTQPMVERNLVQREEYLVDGQSFIDTFALSLKPRLLRALAQVAEPTDLKRIVDLLASTPAGEITREVAACCNAVDPFLGSQLLQTKLQDSHDPALEQVYSRSLFLLELGKIGMSSNVVEYLGTRFVLRVEDDEQLDSARRLTTDGKLGVFSSDGRLAGYIDLRGEVGTNKERQAEVLRITKELLYLRADTDENILQEFLAEYEQFFTTAFVEQTGVRVNDLPLRDQAWLFTYLQRCSQEEKQQVQRFAERFGLDGLSVFVGLEQTDNPVPALVGLGQELSPLGETEKWAEVFHLFAEIIRKADTVENYYQDRLGEQENREDLPRFPITSAMLARGVELLRMSMEDVDKVIRKLHRFDSEIVQFRATFCTAKKENPELQITEVAGLAIREYQASEMKPLRNTLLTMLSENREELGTEMQQKATNEFVRFLDSEIGQRAEYHVLQKDEKPIGFVVFYDVETGDKSGKKHKAARSLNIDVAYRGACLGQSFIEASLNREAERAILHGIVNPEISVIKEYVESTGFHITGVMENYNNTGRDFLQIRCDRSEHIHFQSRTSGIDVAGALQATLGNDEVVARQFDPKVDAKEIVAFAKQALERGYEGVRIVSGDKATFIYVFERTRVV